VIKVVCKAHALGDVMIGMFLFSAEDRWSYHLRLVKPKTIK